MPTPRTLLMLVAYFISKFFLSLVFMSYFRYCCKCNPLYHILPVYDNRPFTVPPVSPDSDSNSATVTNLYFILLHRVLCVVMDTDPISSLSISSATSPIFATYETFLGLSDFYIVMAFRAVLDPLSSCCSCRLCNCLLCTVLVDLQVIHR